MGRGSRQPPISLTPGPPALSGDRLSLQETPYQDQVCPAAWSPPRPPTHRSLVALQRLRAPSRSGQVPDSDTGEAPAQRPPPPRTVGPARTRASPGAPPGPHGRGPVCASLRHAASRGPHAWPQKDSGTQWDSQPRSASEPAEGPAARCESVTLVWLQQRPPLPGALPWAALCCSQRTEAVTRYSRFADFTEAGTRP